MSQKTLGFGDLFFYAAAMALSIRWISVAAAVGPASLPLWLLALVAFSAPLSIASAELTTRFTREGGVYDWVGETFGPFWGFLCGWLYWACNLPFFAAMLVYMLNLAALALGPAGRPLLDHPGLFLGASIALSLAVGALHYLGLGTGKWLSTVGGASGFVLIACLVAIGAMTAHARGAATDFVHASYAPPLNANGAILWATMVFGVGGAEALAFLRNDVRGGMKTVLGVLAVIALMQAVFYIGGTGAMLLILTPLTATRLSGLPDAMILGLKAIGHPGLAPVVLLSAFLCLLGSYSAWFGAAARLPFAAGIDALLPKAFGNRDPKTGAPVTAILVQTAIVVVIVVLSQAGETLKVAYDFLVAMSVLSYTLPFVFLFAVFLAIQGRPALADAWRTPGGPKAAIVIGAVGLAATLVAVACTLVPSPDAKDQLAEVLKLVFASAVLIGSGVLVYALASRGASRRAGHTTEPAP